MSVSIGYELFPLRFSLKVKEPSKLTIKATNAGLKSKLLTLELVLPEQLGLDKGSLNKGLRKRLGEVRPNETKVFETPVYLSPALASEGLFNGQIEVLEHLNDYNEVVRSFKKPISFRIV